MFTGNKPTVVTINAREAIVTDKPASDATGGKSPGCARINTSLSVLSSVYSFVISLLITVIMLIEPCNLHQACLILVHDQLTPCRPKSKYHFTEK